MTKLDTLMAAYDRNKRHSPRLHGGKSLQETGIVKGCYRCTLLVQIEKEKLKTGT